MTPVDVFMLLALVALIGVLLTLVWLDTPTREDRDRAERRAEREAKQVQSAYVANIEEARRRHPAHDRKQ